MNEENMEMETPQTDEVVTTPEVVEDNKELKSALAQKDHFREKAEKAETERKALEAKLNDIQKSGGAKPTLDVEDYIDISASLEGLDQREKEFLAKEHKLTGKPLSEIRKDEDFTLWQSAYRNKVEKEKLALKPSGTQSESDKPQSLAERLASASTADKEKILSEAGLYRSPRPKADRTDIGARSLR